MHSPASQRSSSCGKVVQDGGIELLFTHRHAERYPYSVWQGEFLRKFLEAAFSISVRSAVAQPTHHLLFHPCSQITIVCTGGLGANGAQGSTIRFAGVTSKDADSITSVAMYTITQAHPSKYTYYRYNGYSDSACTTISSSSPTATPLGVCTAYPSTHAPYTFFWMIESCWVDSAPTCRAQQAFTGTNCSGTPTTGNQYTLGGVCNILSGGRYYKVCVARAAILPQD